ncbi:FAD linked oxidase domain protein [Haloterrigena turkmenica DSM 5511]|uniref:FAD linked oxidase domain protein n=1 Tax=Haloterrigena turkmenica (strain ATCC 51198 / DSM 5511 / JCM 9101 / NCIMB 13204 / VKM B-1734 / 4k) TaxID=543526 RepID=D2RQE8_HALTV|nr:FAD-binding oxidoreductase [Haloterrigena turkmenica]ADB62325.1 FAD linked oxidase domain protein [Haloterrigena turkmenica DSM 5511]
MAVTTTPVDDGAIDGFGEGLRGDLLRPEDPNYDDARAIWNGMIDRYPTAIVRAMGVSDVIATVDFAREHDVLLAIRGGGHNIAGNAVCDDGLLLDLSRLRSVRVDPERKTARVEPGATLADFDHEAQAFGLATPLGINSTTGVAGLTLGGGFGWLTRRYGMTVDNLRSVDVVTADGELRHASETENPDLFWGIRGGGGNFGVVTSFEFELHEVGPEVLTGMVVYRGEDAPDVLRHVRDFNEDAPDESTVWVVLRKAPPLPFLPEHIHGEDVIVVVPFYAGDITEGEAVLAPIREYGDPVADVVGPHRYAEFQQAFDPLLTEGARNYWKSHNFSTIPDEAIDTVVEYARNLPTAQSEIFFGQIGGAMGRVPADATAFPHRDAEYGMNVHTRWEDPAMDDQCIAWSREFFDAMAPYATGGVYVNFISEREGEENLGYGENYDRLVDVKTAYDPENLFRMNQNVEPAV